MQFTGRKITKENEDIFRRVVKSRIGGFMLLILSGVLIYNVIKSSIITSEKLEILKQAEGEVNDLRLDNLKLLMLTEYMKSEEYLETEARNRLNLSRKGEVSFVIPDEILERGILDVENVLNDKNESDGIETWKVWYDFFYKGI